MKKIPLTQGKFAIVDDEDYDHLMQWKWLYMNVGYAARKEYLGGGRKNQKQKTIYLHDYLNCPADGLQTDHINENKLDNRKENLRTADRSENQRNKKMLRNNTSGYKGVTWDKKSNKWKAQISINNMVKYLGVFLNKNDAAIAYNDAALKISGEFAALNVVNK